MEPAQHAFLNRQRMIVLHELDVDADLAHDLAAVNLGKKSAMIPMPLGQENFDGGDFGFNDLHKFIFTAEARRTQRNSINDLLCVLCASAVKNPNSKPRV